jgi:hypothetical protein
VYRQAGKPKQSKAEATQALNKKEKVGERVDKKERLN